MPDSWFACGPPPRRVVASGCLLVLAALGLAPIAAVAADDAICSGIDNRSAFQRALAADCETIVLGAELPAMTRALPITRDVELSAGVWSLPPLDVAAEVQVTILGGRAAGHRALVRTGAPVASVIDLGPGAVLTLTDTVVEAAPEHGSVEAVHAVVRQDAGATEGAVVFQGLRTDGALNHILLLQHSAGTASEACEVGATARIGASSAHVSDLELTSGGVLAAAVCTVDGALQPVFERAEGAELAELVLERVMVRGELQGLDTVWDGVPLRFSPIHVPSVVRIEETLGHGVSLTDVPMVAGAGEVLLGAVVVADLSTGSVGLVESPVVEVTQSFFCGVSGDGPLLSLAGSAALSAEVQRTALFDAEVVVVSAPESSDSAVALDHVTLTRTLGGDLVAASVYPSLQNLYIDGPWGLPPLRDDLGDVVTAVRAVGTDCPEGAADCTVLGASAVVPGASACGDVLAAYFAQRDALSDWPRALSELDRLMESATDASLLAGAVTETNRDWGCGGDPVPRVGAWPSESCGLPFLATDPPPDSGGGGAGGGTGGSNDTAQPGLTDTADEGAAKAAGEPDLVFGCQGRSGAAAALLLCLLPGLRRRRTDLEHSRDHGRDR